MGSRRGRLNWSNLEVHISNDAIEKQHHFTIPNSLSSASTEDIMEDEKETAPSLPSIKRSWMPKMGVGEIHAEQFVGNFMLTGIREKKNKYMRAISFVDAEQVAIDQKYKKQTQKVECSPTPTVSKSMRITDRLPANSETVLSTRATNLFVGQHLLNVFVCHVESYSRVYIMFGDDYNRATKLFDDMNTCNELIRPSTIVYE
jgi:hypothetical protein